MDKFNFTTKIYVACSTSELRPIFNCVHIINGFLYAGNGIIVVKQPLSLHSILNPEYLEGKSIHRLNFIDIMAFDTAAANEDGIECKTGDERSAFFAYYDRKDQVLPDFAAIFRGHKIVNIPFIGFSPDNLKLMLNALYLPNGQVKINFGGIDKNMLIETPGVPDQLAIMAPVLIEPTLL